MPKNNLPMLLSIVLGYSIMAADAPHLPPTEAGRAVAPVEPCSVEGLTDRCRALDPKKADNDRLTLPDGTFIPNLASILTKKKPSEFEQWKNKLEADKALKARKFALQRSIERSLAGLRGTVMHEDYKVYLRDPQALIEIGKAVRAVDEEPAEEAAENREDQPDLSLWWPPEKPDPAGSPEEISVSLEDAKAKVRKIFPTKRRRTRFLRIVEEAIALADQAQAVANEGDDRNRPRAEKPAKPPIASVRDNPTVKAMGEVTEARKEHLKELFDFSRKSLIEVVRRGKKNTELSDAQKASIAKIEAITFPNDPDEAHLQSSCLGVFPNAHYDPEDHTINICRNYYNFPDTDLVNTFGHEMFHAIDPCNVQFDTFEFNHTAYAKLSDEKSGHPVKAIRDSDNLFQLWWRLDKASRSGKTASVYPLDLPVATVDYFTRGEDDERVLKRVAKGVRFSPDPKKSEYPFKNVYACLQRADRGGFRAESPEKIKRFAEAIARYRARTLGRGFEYDPAEDAKHIAGAFAAYPECLGLQTRSQMCETMADWAGAKVLGKFLKGKVLRTQAEKLGPLATYMNEVCLAQFKLKEDGLSGRPSSVLTRAEDTRDLFRDEHPAALKRANELLLRETNVAKAVCGEAPAGKFCEEDEKL